MADEPFSEKEADAAMAATINAAAVPSAMPGVAAASLPADALRETSNNTTTSKLQELSDLPRTDTEQVSVSVETEIEPAPENVPSFLFEELKENPPSHNKATLDLLEDVQLDLKIELGRTSMNLKEVLQLGTGAVVSLDKATADLVDIVVNGQLVARGEVLTLNNRFCVRIGELMTSNNNK